MFPVTEYLSSYSIGDLDGDAEVLALTDGDTLLEVEADGERDADTDLDAEELLLEDGLTLLDAEAEDEADSLLLSEAEDDLLSLALGD